MLTDYTAMAVASIMILIAIVALLAKLSPSMMRRTLGYDFVVDCAAFIVMKYLFFGTATGMLLAFGGGLMFSIVLMIAKAIIGYEKLERVPCTHCGAKPLRWVRHPARWQRSIATPSSSRSVTA